MSILSLLKLPIEVLHRIFDNLDAETLIFSLGNVCEQFRTIILNYQFQKLDFTTISKDKFHQARRAIRPKHVASLTLSDGFRTPGQIQLFSSFFRVRTFSRLNSLILLDVSCDELRAFLGLILHTQLTSLTIETRIDNGAHYESDSISFLSPILSHRHLRTLNMNICNSNTEQMDWSVNSTIRNLRVTSLNSKQICGILCNYSCLQSLTLESCKMRDFQKIINEISSFKAPCKYLTRLTLENNAINIEKLDLFLSVTSLLKYLRIIDDISFPDTIFDGSYWETLIQNKLPNLQKFEFFFGTKTKLDCHSFEIKSLIIPFQSPFWLEEKQIAIKCDYIRHSQQILLYSLPICRSSLTYVPDLYKISYSNLQTFDNKLTTMDNIHCLQVNFNDNVNYHIESSLFRNLTELHLTIDIQWPIDGFPLNFSRIEKLSLNIDFTKQLFPNVINSIRQLLEGLSSLQSLSVSHFWTEERYMTNVENICAMIPQNIKHFEVKVRNFDEIKMIIEKLERLCSVTFAFAQNQYFVDAIIDWLITFKRKRPTYWKSQFSLHIWLGQLRNN